MNIPNKHNGRKYQGGAENISPVTRDLEKYGGNGIAKNFSKGNHELVQRNQVTTDAAFDCFCNVNGNRTTF